MDSGNLLDQVFLDFKVEPVGRRRHDEIVAIAHHGKAEVVEHLGNRVCTERNAQHAAHACRTQADRRTHRQLVGSQRLLYRAG